MSIIAFIVIYLSVIITSYYLVKKSGIKLNKLSIPMVVFWFIMAISYIGYPVLFFKLYPYYVNIGVTDQNILWKAFLISSFVWLQFFSGYLIFARLIKNKNMEISINYDKSISILIWLLFFGLSCLVLYLYINQVSQIALLGVFKGYSPMELSYLRSQMTNNFFKYHRFSMFFEDILPFLTYLALAEYFRKNNWIWMILTSASFCLTAFALLMTLQKGPFIFFLIGLIMIYYIFRSRTIHFKNVLKIAGICFTIIFMIYITFMGGKINTTSLVYPLERFTVGQIVPWYFYVDIFPNKIDFVNGRTLPNPNDIFPWTPYPYTVEVSRMAIPHPSNIVGSAPTAFFGELWVDFGYWLLFLTPIYIGMLVMFIHMLFSRKPISSIGIALMVWLALDLTNLATSGISHFILNLSLIAILTICFILIMFRASVHKRRINDAQSTSYYVN